MKKYNNNKLKMPIIAKMNKDDEKDDVSLFLFLYQKILNVSILTFSLFTFSISTMQTSSFLPIADKMRNTYLKV